MDPLQSSATTPTPSPLTRGRFVGAAAMAVAVAVIAENAVLAGTGAPSFATPIKDVLAYYAANRAPVAIASGLVAVYLPLLLLFLIGLQALVERRGGWGADWARFAVAAGGVLSAVFVLVNVLQVGLALSAGQPAQATPALELVWHVHAAAFALALPMLGATLVGTALAAHASGLTPAWQRLLGLVGGGLLFAAGIGNLAIADGSALVFVGLLGLASWLVWLLVTGVRLVRTPLPSDPTGVAADRAR